MGNAILEIDRPSETLFFSNGLPNHEWQHQPIHMASHSNVGRKGNMQSIPRMSTASIVLLSILPLITQWYLDRMVIINLLAFLEKRRLTFRAPLKLPQSFGHDGSLSAAWGMMLWLWRVHLLLGLTRNLSRLLALAARGSLLLLPFQNLPIPLLWENAFAHLLNFFRSQTEGECYT